MRYLVIILLFVSGLSHAQQFARPASDFTLGTWTDNGLGTTDIFLAIDEVSASDADFVLNNNNTNDTYETGLSGISEPDAGTVTIRYRYSKSAAGGNARDIQLFLYEGVTLISSGTLHTGITETWTAGTWDLSGAEVSSITNWGDLRLRVTASGTTGGAGSNRRSVRCSWAELQAPDAPAAATRRRVIIN